MKYFIFFIGFALLFNSFLVFAEVDVSDGENNPSNGVVSNGGGKGISDALSDIKSKTGLTSGDIASEVTPRVIKILLSVFSILVTGASLWAGSLYIISNDDEDKISQAKKIMIYTIIAVVCVALSYTLVSGVIGLDFSR